MLTAVLAASVAGSAPDGAEPSEFEAMVRRSRIVFVGTVLELGEPPAFCQNHPGKCRSSHVPRRQNVVYRVDEVLRGDLEANEPVEIRHILYFGDGALEPGRFALSESLFRPGKRLIVFANPSPGWIEADLRGRQVVGFDPTVRDAVVEMMNELR